MEIQLDTLINIGTLLLGGGGGAFFTWRWQRAKAKAEAKAAESSAANAEQDVYQQIINDLKADREDMKANYLDVKRDRDEIRQERDELRRRLDSMEDNIRKLKDDVDSNRRRLECLRPMLCGRAGCPDRVDVTVSESGEIRTKRKAKNDS